MDPFISADWLAAHLSDVVVCHVGSTMAGTDPLATFADGHIPGARFVSLDVDLAGAPAPIVGRHPLPSPTRFEEVLADRGIGHDTRVVAYDDRGGAFAARMVWMLRIIGQDAALLAEPWTGERETGEPAPADRADRRAIDWPDDAVADADDVVDHLGCGGVVVDSRDAARYRGEVEPIDAVAGHVPGAINISFTNADPDRFAPLTETAEAAIVYCGSGVTACVNALAIEAAGLPTPRVYVGSWSGWSSDPGRPVATGDER